MNIQDLLEQYKLNEQTELFTPQTLRDTINKITLDDVELEEDEQIKTHVLKTMYNDYTGYGLEYDDLILVPFGDWKSYLKDVANEFAQCLPDGFEDFVDVESLFNYMLKDTYYLVQAINMINKTSEEDYERYEKVDSGEVDSISYVIVREVNWYGYGKDVYEEGTYQTDKIVCEQVQDWNTAWLKFQAGEVDSISYVIIREVI